MRMERVAYRRLAAGAVETVGAVAVATGVVAALDSVAPETGLGVVYMLAVLLVAIRRGQVAAAASAVLSVLALNYFFIEPRHRLTISESQNVVALVVLFIAALVVGRLAAEARRRQSEAELQAREAAAREQEAALLAAAASAVLEGRGIESQLRSIERSVESGAGASHVRLELNPVPSPRADEIAVRLGTARRAGWLYVSRDAGWQQTQLERVGEALGRLVDVAVERDRVADREAETEAARRADAAKTVLLQAISHDLRSPLTAITTATEGLEGELSDEDREELVSVIRLEAARLSRLIDDLLDLSKIQAGAVNPRRDWTDLRDAVGSAARHVASRAHGHRIEIVLPDELPLVRADQAQLERVFANLLENAVRFSPPDIPVQVRGGVGGGRVTVRVVDRGRGIPAGQRARIFEPFFRGPDSGRGSGLGLAISRGFVEANGGRIAVQSGSGDGTAFAVSFPLEAQPVTA